MEMKLRSGRIVEIELLIDECKGPINMYKIGQVKVEHEPNLDRIWIHYLPGQEPKKEPWRYADHKGEASRVIAQFQYFLVMPISKMALCKEEHGGSEVPQEVPQTGKKKTEYINFTPLWITNMKSIIIRHRRHNHDPLRKPGDVLCEARTMLTQEQIDWLISNGYHDSCHICQLNRNKRCTKACSNPLVTSQIKIFERRETANA